MSDPHRSQQLAQLQAVMGVRVRRAHALYLAKLTSWREARAKLLELQEEMAGLDNDLQSVVDYMSRIEVAADPQRLQWAISRRHWTIYDRDKAKYYLDVAESDLNDADVALQSRKKQWLKLLAQENKLAELQAEALLVENQLLELREERDTEEQSLSLLGLPKEFH